ncbi:MAG: cation:proton antiporter [Flavobacteriales bacterium]|nr:cation:proton antiporter [Flavobacteriales bacterium]
MLLFHALDFSLPLKNPVLLFAMILFIILFAPIVLNKLKIPHLIGLIIAGALIGPFGLNLMLRDSSIVLFGTVGLLYIMFLAGLEIDMAEFKKNSGKSLTFGLLTFLIPMAFGTASGHYLLGFTLPTSILMASMFASHTLIAYPIISKLGIVKNRAVNVTVGGTMVTDTLALLVLAGVTGLYTGEADKAFWIQLGISVLLFGSIVMLVFPIIGRWFFKRFDDNVSQYIFVLSMVFLGGFLAEAAGVEAIIGAFLAGLALNRLIPHTSPLMNRIEFVGNALFIPFFLIGVGMLIDYRAFIHDWDTIKVAVVMTVMAELSKYLSAYLTQKIFGFTADERRVIFGLGSAHAAATLAIVLVGYNIILNTDAIAQAAALGFVLEPVRLLNESVLNGTILMILVTCTIATFVAQKGAQGIALAEASEDGVEALDQVERILIPVARTESTADLVNLAVTVKSKSNRRGMYALHVLDNTRDDSRGDKTARKVLDLAAVTAASTDNHVQELLRYDMNVVNAIASVVKEHRISDIILGLHEQDSESDSFLGNLTNGVLSRCNTTTLIYRPIQPLGTIKRHLVIIPDKAEKEMGFPFWLIKVWNIARNTGAKLVFFSSEQTLQVVKEVHAKHPIEAEFRKFGDWDDFLILSRDVKAEDSLFIVMSRAGHPSHQSSMSRIPGFLRRYFKDTSFILAYPMQSGVAGGSNSLMNASVLEPFKENLDRLDELGQTIASLFKRK